MKAFRFLLAAYCLGTFVFSLTTTFAGGMTAGRGVLTAAGLVFYIVSLGGLLAAHAKEGRPVRDLILVVLYPVAVYALVTGSTRLNSRPFWMFLGHFYFLALAGGFLSGVLLSPLIAARGPLPRDAVKGLTKAGLRFVLNPNGPAAFAAVLFLGTVASLAVFLRRLAAHVGDLSPARQGLLYGLFAAALVLVCAFSYRHTSFGIAANPRLRDAYGQGETPPPA